MFIRKFFLPSKKTLHKFKVGIIFLEHLQNTHNSEGYFKIKENIAQPQGLLTGQSHVNNPSGLCDDFDCSTSIINGLRLLPRILKIVGNLKKNVRKLSLYHLISQHPQHQRVIWILLSKQVEAIRLTSKYSICYIFEDITLDQFKMFNW